MLTTPDNELLVRTGPATVMGEYFRRYWLPVALSREMPTPDSPPIRVKAMGEELVAFRDTNGRVGLIEPRCAHRGSDSESKDGLKEWLREDRAITPEEQQAAAGARRHRELCAKNKKAPGC